ncbi:efflux RND transporter permease subunit [Octadecabacter sp. G9-8]|uniref:Efflux RND transporter permease subunit n=1 Tax=Octadecabacter dasysiphoniae TaxID=2909341 RepID=A0ABS9CUL8_9RHOB|nr:efflux RND transporter permease subunit [Octadecabacter dasysiphoniae]MCF2870927.1 efflux RND transporter permease subunit [Octadecabacter dasysiphoniae]
MNIARASIDKPILTWMVILISLFGGIWGFSSLGRLEDPAFTIKTAIVITEYPGASAEQVMNEVTEPLEAAIQGMGEIDTINSVNQPGLSRIEIDIKPTYSGADLPAIWSDLRDSVADAARFLPEGTSEPYVNDSFGDVFGIFYAVTSDGYSDQEKHLLAQFLRREILAVDGVANVEVQGLPDEAIFVEPDMTLMAHQNISPEVIISALSSANSIDAAGSVDGGLVSTPIQTPIGSDSVTDIAGLTVGVDGEVVNLIDIAQVSRDRQADPSILIRYNGQEAFTIGVAGLSTENIVEVGKRVDARLAAMDADIPVGIKLHPIYEQHTVVDEASNAFLVNLAMSVAIVVLVLAVFMGPRAAMVVGSTLLLTVVGTLLFMALFSIEMERISLGALIIAMGMLVDNAIVVAEGMQIAMLRGKSSRDAADEAAGKTQVPLLGATVIGIMAFAGIGLSPDSTGEFLFSLFAVISISLMLSWVLALTVTPLLGHYFFKQGAAGTVVEYSGLMFRAYGALLGLALKFRWAVVAGLVVITVGSFWGFGQVKQQFFPNSNTPLFFAHYKLEQGTPIEVTSAHLAQLETWLAEQDSVVSTSTFVGQGAARFMLTYSGESPNPSYGHLIIRADNLDAIPDLQQDLETYAASILPEGEFRTARLVFGPGGGDPIEVRFSGPDPKVLRDLSDQAMSVMAQTSSDIALPRTNWREQELVLRPNYAVERAQTAGVTRENVAQIFSFATDGITAGAYREGDRQLPIIVRVPQAAGLSPFDMVVASGAGTLLPIEQVVDGYMFEAQNTLMHRRGRVPTITVGASIAPDVTAAKVHGDIRAAIEAIPLPSGYLMEWGGEFENSARARSSLAQQLPLSILIMVLISVLLFNAIRQPLIIWLLVPMAVNGVTIGLLGTGLPFTFTALLGLLSLSGMLIKNGIVLIEEIDLVRAEGLEIREAIVTASKSRLRPVMLAAATTILGMAPLLTDAFFVSMSVTIMAGLAFASILTLIAAPVLYDIFFGLRRKDPSHGVEDAEFSTADIATLAATQ